MKFPLKRFVYIMWSNQQSKDKPKALKRDSIYNIDMLF